MICGKHKILRVESKNLSDEGRIGATCIIETCDLHRKYIRILIRGLLTAIAMYLVRLFVYTMQNQIITFIQ